MGHEAHEAGAGGEGRAEQNIALAMLLDFVGNHGGLLKVFAVGRQPDFHRLREEDTGTGLLHKGAAYEVDVLLGFQIDDHIDIRQEALPAAVSVRPAASQTVCEGGFAGCGIAPVPQMVVGHFLAHGLVPDSVLEGRALAVFLVQVEGVVAGGDEGIVPTGYARAETLFAGRLGPAHLRYGGDARVHHILVVFIGGDPFGPEVSLHAQKVHFGPLGHPFQGLVGMGDIQREEAAEALRLVDGGVLHLVQVAVAAGRHHCVVALLDGFQTTLGAPPAHDGSVGGEAAFQDLVPAQQLSAVGVDKALDAFDQIALEFFYVGQSFGLHPGLAVRAFLPVVFVGLVSSHVDVRGREELYHFFQYAFQQFKGGFLAGAQLVASFPAAYFRIGKDHFPAMAGHLDFRNHVDVQLGCPVQDFPDIGLGEIASPGFRGAFLRVLTPFVAPVLPGFAYSPGGLPGEKRVLVYLDAPAGVVRQVHVELVDLETGQGFQLLQDEILVPEMAGDIHHKAAVLETGIIVHRSAGLHLFEGLQGIEISLLRIGLNLIPLRRNDELVGLLPGESGQAGRLFGKGLAADLAGELPRQVGRAFGRDELQGSGHLGIGRCAKRQGGKQGKEAFHTRDNLRNRRLLCSSGESGCGRPHCGGQRDRGSNGRECPGLCSAG